MREKMPGIGACSSVTAVTCTSETLSNGTTQGQKHTRETFVVNAQAFLLHNGENFLRREDVVGADLLPHRGHREGAVLFHLVVLSSFLCQHSSFPASQ